MKTAFATLIALGLFAGSAAASTPFTTLADTAPRSVFDDIRDTSPRSDGVFGDLEKNAP